MRIACLQFDPQVGEVDDNLNRADAVLAKVNPDDLDGLDLLVLPELAFAGYNFKSLQHIAPFLEEAGSGITSLWAKTTALKHDCTVVVGYPEKVDVSAKWPASPEYHNSALVVNGDGDIAGNYRKSFLYYTDETWALEGAGGFFKRQMPGLGNVAMGICTDLNPYKLEASWDAFEFGFHVLKAQANLVILTMAWQTHQDLNEFNHNPAEPDLETLVYWVQRLEPLIRADNEEEVIVVFCNRTGAEDEATYTGTSAVIGIKRGEVFVYGVLGRGVNDLLVVDTDQPPMSKLTDADAVEGDEYAVEQPAPYTEVDSRQVRSVPSDLFSEEHQVLQCLPTDSRPPLALGSPRSPTSPRLPWLAQSIPGETPTDSRSPTRLQIPTRPQFDEYMAMDSAITDDIIIDTPALPNTPGFAKRSLRPKLAIPGSPWRFPNKASPYPWHHHDGSHSAVFGGGATMTPITPFDEDGWSSTPIDPKAPPPWFWKHEPTLSALKESIIEEEEEEEPSESPESQPLPSVAEGKQEPISLKKAEPFQEDDEKQAVQEELRGVTTEAAPLNDWADLAEVLEGFKARPGSAFDFRSSRDDRPSSPKSRNVSRTSSPFRMFQVSELNYGEWDSTAWGAPDSDLYRPASPRTVWEDNASQGDSHMFARPTSRTGHRLVQRSNSFDGSSGAGGGGRQRNEGTGRRQPSRLRHAIFFPDEDGAGSEIEDDSDPDLQQNSPGSINRGRQPLPRRETYPEERPACITQAPGDGPTKRWDDQRDVSPISDHGTATFPIAGQLGGEQLAFLADTDIGEEQLAIARETKHHHSSPLSMAAIQSTTVTTATSTTTPSLCSATSATSTASVVTMDDGPDVGSTLGTDLDEAVDLGECGAEQQREKVGGVFTAAVEEVGMMQEAGYMAVLTGTTGDRA